MGTAHHKLSRPVYEGLPWAYLLGGLVALGVSYLQESTALSLLLGLPGLLAVLAGVVVLLRRRGYRRLRAQYDAPEALDEATGGVGRQPDDPASRQDAA
jgi:UDP-N-acetylmuramyl pentapeptide phosphotransferase/UDP-N-acetylglucosamine-1-phosphate transferase